MKRVYEERNWRSLFQAYQIGGDRIRIQTILRFYWLDILYSDIEKIEIGKRPVIWDCLRKGYIAPKYAFGLRILKNDLADLVTHVTIGKRSGFWRQVRISPRNPERFIQMLREEMGKR